MSQIDLSFIRTNREKVYSTLALIIGTGLWLVVAFFILKGGGTALGITLFYIALILFMSWIGYNVFKAIIFGNAIHVNPDQYPELYKVLEEQAGKLGLDKIPDCFILGGGGLLNAFATKLFHRRYIILYAELVDFCLERGELDELKVVIGHEMAHHVLGHTDALLNFLRFWLMRPLYWLFFYYISLTTLLIKTTSTDSEISQSIRALFGDSEITLKVLVFLPSFSIIMFIISFFYSKAYRRACELSCDRVGFILLENAQNNLKTTHNLLIGLVGGSKYFANKTNHQAFKDQEKKLPLFFTWLVEKCSEYPRMTKRVIELEKFRDKQNAIN